jgi:hypothetical protein
MLYLCIDGEIMEFSESESYPGEFMSQPGYCRLINGKKCSCTRVCTLRDGTCPCAPHIEGAPIVRRGS